MIPLYGRYRDPRQPSRYVITVGAILVLVAGCRCGGQRSSVQSNPTPSPEPVARPTFQRQRAIRDLRKQCDFGPRNPGSEGHQQCRKWLVQQLSGMADRVIKQNFRSRTPFGGPYDFQNIVAIFRGQNTDHPILLGAHWDTRPVADEDPDPDNRNLPIIGANDGASGVAVLLELARLMARRSPTNTIIMAFFDAEDSGRQGVEKFPYDGFCIGSNYLAKNWIQTAPSPEQMILVDLVGTDRTRNPRLQSAGESNPPKFRLEGNSLASNPALVDQIWSIAERRGHDSFVRSPIQPLTDDHKPFIDNGLPAVDIVHVFPAEWHTVDDTPENCSADTLYQVGDTLIDIIWR